MFGSITKSTAKTKDLPKQSDKKYRSKAISEKDNPNFVFKDDIVEEVGKQPDAEIK
jgi:hypothetical protein